jgi:nicotinamide phosphoribosyltransferase
MSNFKINPLLMTDGYKLNHHLMYPENTTLVYSNFTPRNVKYMPDMAKDIVVFGTQYTIKYINDLFTEHFFKQPEEIVIKQAKEFLDSYLMTDYSVEHFKSLHKLGYLPVVIKALDEGTIITPKIPILTIKNTLPEFFWLPNYLETLISSLLWKPLHSASMSYGYRKILNKYTKETDPSNLWLVDFQAHDFSFRGMQHPESAISSGLGFITSFKGSDSIPVLQAAEYYYNSKDVVFGVPASEHAIMTSYGKENEIDAFRRLMKQFPKGILSVVSDSFDLWKVCTEYVTELKEEILARDGKLVIRPDSGDPVEIVCGINSSYLKFNDKKSLNIWLSESESNEGAIFEFKDQYYRIGDVEYFIREYGVENTDLDFDHMLDGRQSLLENVTKTINKSTASFKGVIELLWDVFGGTINEQGYKVLDSHIGCIYGDSITLERAETISKRLKEKGFASTNIVYGSGSFSMGYATRDNQGNAVKATYCVVNGIGREIFKDPITDDGTKKSAKGLLKVDKDEKGKITLYDQVSETEEETGLLIKRYENGVMMNETDMNSIRERILNTL